MKMIHLYTPEEKSVGLLRYETMPEDTLLVFHNIVPNEAIHARGMKFPFGVAAIGSNAVVLAAQDMEPGDALFMIPIGTRLVVEGPPGWYKKEARNA